jgi:hypothetical protein
MKTPPAHSIGSQKRFELNLPLDGDPTRLLAIATKLSSYFKENRPFPYLVIESFFIPELAEQIWREASAVDLEKANNHRLGRRNTHNKFAFMPWQVGPATLCACNLLTSGAFLQFLEMLTGVQGLLADPSYEGGGLHVSRRGGFLNIHADFNHLPKYNLERRLNLLIYLNKGWQEHYEGHLQLHNYEDKSLSARIWPTFNRAVIFTTTERSLHGHPVPLNCPESITRKSLALYYYTNTWNGNSQAHNTIYHAI